MGYSEARGPLTYEKNLKSKFSCQTPFKAYAFNSRETRIGLRKPGFKILLMEPIALGRGIERSNLLRQSK
jgi:hypothetical protein